MAKPGLEQSTFPSPGEPLLAPPPYYATPPPPEDPYAYVLIPVLRPRHRRRRNACCGGCLSSLISSSSLLALAASTVLLAGALFFLYPADPDIRVARLGLRHVRVATSPVVSLTISMDLEVRVWNQDFFSLDYDSIVVSIGYRGKRLGSVDSAGGHIRARGVSYVDAELVLDGIEVIGDVFYLIDDLARGSIPLETITKVNGQLHYFWFDIPIQGMISCSVNVNPNDQTVIRQDCYPQ